MHQRVGLVHDYLLVLRGAERAFSAMAALWPEAPIHSTLYSEDGTQRAFAGREVHTSYLQRTGVGQRGFRRLLPLYPRAVESLELGDSELVVSSSSAFAHGVLVGARATHVCYCHSPFRYAWHERETALREVPGLLRPAVRAWLERFREWDRSAATRVTRYVTVSRMVAGRIDAYYGRDAAVIHPPVDIERFAIGEPEDYLLFVGELVAHKRIDVALEAARRAGRRIKVVGEGPELERLRAGFGDDAEFLGRVSDAELERVYSGALALVVPNVEEFGIAAVESQAAGRPVLAIDAGGTAETVVDGETGILVTEGSVDEFAEAMREADFTAFSPARIRKHSARFSTERFSREFAAEVAAVDQG